MITKFELNRKIFHIVLGTLLCALIYYEIITPLLLLAITLLGGLTILLQRSHPLPLITRFIETFERESYKQYFPGRGIFFFFCGATISAYFFPKNIAVASLLILTFGDSTAHLVGAGFGKIKNPLSTDLRMIEGLIAAILISIIVTIPFVPLISTVAGSTIALLTESITLRIFNTKIDDNLFIPIIAGVVMMIV